MIDMTKLPNFRQKQQRYRPTNQAGGNYGGIDLGGISSTGTGTASGGWGEPPWVTDPNWRPSGYVPGTTGGGGGGYDPYADELMGEEDFLYPEEWGWAGDTFREMSDTGSPVDVEGYRTAQTPVWQRAASEMAMDVLEKAGLGGKRWSSTAQNAIGRENERFAENFSLAMADRELQAQEAAKARRIQGAYGGMELGQRYSDLPMAVAAQMMGGAESLQNQEMQPFEFAYNDWQRGLEENDPWMRMIMQLLGGGSQYGMPSYTPGWGTQLMELGGGLLPMILSMMGKSGKKTSGAGTSSYQPTDFSGNFSRNFGNWGKRP